MEGIMRWLRQCDQSSSKQGLHTFFRRHPLQVRQVISRRFSWLPIIPDADRLGHGKEGQLRQEIEDAKAVKPSSGSFSPSPSPGPMVVEENKRGTAWRHAVSSGSGNGLKSLAIKLWSCVTGRQLQ